MELKYISKVLFNVNFEIAYDKSDETLLYISMMNGFAKKLIN